MTVLQSINPATGELIERFPAFTPDATASATTSAYEAFKKWSLVSFEERSEVFRRAASLLRAEAAKLAATITREMGKPLAEAEAEVEKCAWGCEFFAERAASFLAEETVPSDSPNSSIRYEPLGVVLAIMPWNFPFWQVFRFCAPALMAGNTMLLKHAPTTTRCGLAIEDLMKRAGAPEGVLTTLIIEVGQVQDVIADPKVSAVTLTGSGRAGASVASVAGRHLKKTVLELGGSDPFIVLGGADLPQAVDFGIKSRFQNAGQSCIAAKRFILESAIAEEFRKRFVDATQRLVVGDPNERATQIGPLARDDLRENLHRQVTETLAGGGKLLAGGDRIEGPGFFYQPTVVAAPPPRSPLLTEEVFGPVAAMVEVTSAWDAVSVANDTEYGLGANLWTGDIRLAEQVAGALAAGGVFINGMTHSDPRLPFGGVKKSGWGRELSLAGIREFVNIKTVWRP